jgi:hypothetical protein
MLMQRWMEKESQKDEWTAGKNGYVSDSFTRQLTNVNARRAIHQIIYRHLQGVNKSVYTF